MIMTAAAGRRLALALLLAARAMYGELVLLDAPLAPADRVLLTGRYASLETRAADAARADVVARVAFVAQPPASRRAGCPTYAAVAGMIVLELDGDMRVCSIGARVALAAAAGAVGWLHEQPYPEGALRAPGSHAYALGVGDVATLASAPPAVELAQRGAGLAWLRAAAVAGAAPRVSLRLRAPDGWAAARGSAWVRLLQAGLGLSSLAVLELALCRLHALLMSKRAFSLPPPPAITTGGASRASFVSARAWRIGPTVLVLCAARSMLLMAYVLTDPLWLFGLLTDLQSQLLLFAPLALGFGAQAVQLVYTHESLTRAGGIDTLMLVGRGHQACLLGGLGASITGVLLLAELHDRRAYLVMLALGFAAPIAVAAACVSLVRTARAITASSHVEAKLRTLLAGNCLVATATLAFFFTHATPAGALVSACVAHCALDAIAYTQCEHIAPVGVRPRRGPLRLVVEGARAAWHALARAARARARRRRIAPSSETSFERPLAQSVCERASAGERSLRVSHVSAEDEPPLARAPSRSARSAAMPRSVETSGAFADSGDTLSFARRAALAGGLARPPSASSDLADSHLALGVSLACLRDFAAVEGAGAACTTAELVARVRRTTEASRLSFAELHALEVASDGFAAVGVARVFVSHAQSSSYFKLLDALDAFVTMHAVERKDAFFWLDLLCIRQHEVAADVLRIGEVIGTIGKVAMVLDPWDRPLCLERIWCLYEIAQTVGHEPNKQRRAAAARPHVARRNAREREREPSPLARQREKSPWPACLPTPTSPPPQPNAASGAEPPPWQAAASHARLEPQPAARSHSPRASELSLREERPQVKLFLTMSKAEHIKLVHAARTSRSQIERALTRFDCRAAGASVEADRLMILEYIAKMYALDERAGAPPDAAGGGPPPPRARGHDVVVPAPPPLLRARVGSTALIAPRPELAAPRGQAADADATAATAAFARDEAAATDRAYEHFNERVKLAIREAIAALSHVSSVEHVYTPRQNRSA